MKAKAGGKGRARELPPDAARLLEIIYAEIRSPVDAQKLLGELPAFESCPEEAREFLKAKDKATRREAFVQSERLWFNKYGWFMARVLTLYGLLVFVLFFAVQGALGVDFISALLLGAAGYYLLLVTLSNLRYREGNRRRRRLVEGEGLRYQRDIVRVAARLLRRFGVEPERYPVDSPRSPAGLAQREEGYFIPLD